MSFSSGLGSAPHVRMMGPGDHGIQVLCSSGGWFPKPWVQWRHSGREAAIHSLNLRLKMEMGSSMWRHLLWSQTALWAMWPCSIRTPSLARRKRQPSSFQVSQAQTPEAELGVFQAGRNWRRAEEEPWREGRASSGRSLTVSAHACVRSPSSPRDVSMEDSPGWDPPCAAASPHRDPATLAGENIEPKPEKQRRKRRKHLMKETRWRRRKRHIQSRNEIGSKVKSEVPGKAADAVCRVKMGKRKNCSRILRKTQGAKEFTDLGVLCWRKPVGS